MMTQNIMMLENKFETFKKEMCRYTDLAIQNSVSKGKASTDLKTQVSKSAQEAVSFDNNIQNLLLTKEGIPLSKEHEEQRNTLDKIPEKTDLHKKKESILKKKQNTKTLMKVSTISECSNTVNVKSSADTNFPKEQISDEFSRKSEMNQINSDIVKEAPTVSTKENIII